MLTLELSNILLLVACFIGLLYAIYNSILLKGVHVGGNQSN